MAQVRPFRALRPVPEKAAQVAAPPYDVVTREEARNLAEGNLLSFLRVSRSEITLADGVDPYSTDVYEAARSNFAELIRRCPLEVEREAALYLYRLQMGDRVQVGVAGVFSIDEYDQGIIRRHERTRQDKEDDRTRHILTLRAQTGPVFLAYRGDASINRMVEAELRRPPLFDFVAPDGIAHTLWKVTDSRGLARAFEKVAALYIADGHHRAASASRARARLREEEGGCAGGMDRDFFLAVAFPAEQLVILPYNRVIRDLNGRTSESLLREIRGAGFALVPDSPPEPRAGAFSMYLGRRWYGIAPLTAVAPEGAPSPTRRLDVSILQDRILRPILGIEDPRTDRRIEFVGGIRGVGELERWVDSGRAAVAFSLHPATLEDLMEISDAGEIMPPKSTWFEPKLRDGLLIHLIQPVR